MGLTYAFAGASDVGRLRQNNEDSLLWDSDLGLAILADGMGGYNAGEVASRMAVEAIADGLRHWQSQAKQPISLRALKHAMATCTDEANRAIFDAAYASHELAGMGTTLVYLSLAVEGYAVIAHAGDSRAYRLRQGVLSQLTRDHSLLQEQVDAGLLTPEQVEAFGYRNFITRALGVEDTVVLDIHEYPVEPGDLFLLCSDGLTDMVNEVDILTVLADESPLSAKVDTLIEWANSNGGRDNVTVLLIQAQNAHGLL